MIIKSLTCSRNDYSTITNLAKETQEPICTTKNGEGDPVAMSIEAFERQVELIRLRTKLELAEQSRLAGDPNYTIDISKKRLQKILDK
ncbi:MAG: type II toxin-antitoxin system Phd/YefM family antitoxin [Bacillota bacterium]